MPDAYDEQPYTEHAYAETHPSRMAAVARLSGWPAPPVTGARVLELGCGRGGNLLPMAAGLPQATFVGVDASEVQIAVASRIAAEAGLPNVRFVRGRFDEVALEAGAFDYVVCHGVFSWIPVEARRSLLGAIARSLAPSGIGHVSFNVLPGWYERLAARDWLRFSSTLEGQGNAAASLAWLRDRISPELGDYRRRIAAVERRLAETDAAYARHEYMAEEHHPLLVRDFLSEAAGAGLVYLGDAIPAATALELLPDEARARAAALDVSAAQQVVDFVRNTAFRRALLVRADEARSRAWKAPAALGAGALHGLHVASRLRPREGGGAIETFEDASSGEAVQLSDASVRGALHALAAAPAPLAFDDLPPSPSLATEIFDLWLATGALDLLHAPPAFATRVPERPVACPVARWHAVHGGPVTSRLHQEVLVPDAIVRWVLGRLDGTRTAADLVREVRSMEGAAAVTEAELAQVISACLQRLVACALVV